jgi:alpha-beta hydrolase superfamily lysophospholipase
MLVAAVWIISVWVLVLIGVSFAATIPLMRRREPDPADHPLAHGLPCEDAYFPSRDGLMLAGWWIAAPAHPDNPRGTVILCPGQNGSMDKDVPQAVPLHRAGFNVLMFDFRAHGRSEGHTVTMGALEQADLLGAVDYVAHTRGDARIGVLGFSMGAGVGLMAAAQDARITALVVDGAYSRLVELLANWMRMRGIPGWAARGLAWLALIAGSLRTQYLIYRANPIHMANRVQTPTLFIHGDLDPFTTKDEIAALVARIPGETDLWRVVDAGHREAFARHPDEYNRRVIAWFEVHL